MLNLDQCLGANRPLIFTVSESDMEVLQHLDRKYKDRRFFIYSTTLAKIVPLPDLLKTHFQGTTTKAARSVTTVEALGEILNKDFNTTNDKFETYVFLNADNYINDKQIIRRIKDIVARYQLDEGFTVNMVFISQTVMVPMDLERLAEVVFFNLPTETECKEFSDFLTNKLDLKDDRKLDKAGNVLSGVDRRPSLEVVNNLKGLTRFEMEQAYLQSFHIYKAKEGAGRIDLEFIRNFKKSAIAKTDLLSLMESDVTFDKVGGLGTLKSWVKKCYGGWTVEGKAFGLPQLKGLLMVGLSGCGKSLVSKAIGNEWGLPVLNFDPTRIFSSRVGDSEANMRRVLSIIETVSPCVLLIDEIEKGFAGMQSSTFSDAGTTARTIGQFLIWMQECTAPVFTVATSNNIAYLPPELIGRFDECFFVNMPQVAERKDIFSIHFKKFGRDPSKFDLEKIAEKSQDLSGREIEQALKEALYDAFYKKIDLTTEVILEVLSKKTSLLTTMAEQLNYLIRWVGWDSQKKDGIRARFASPMDEMDRSRVMSEIDTLLKEVANKPLDPNSLGIGGGGPGKC